MSPRVSSQPIQIPEIPPFRKQAHSTMHSPVSQSPQNLGLVNASPPRIAEIPPFRPRIRSKEWMPNIEVSRMKVSSQQTNPAVLTCVDLHSFFPLFCFSCKFYNFVWNKKSTKNIKQIKTEIKAHRTSSHDRAQWRRRVGETFEGGRSFHYSQKHRLYCSEGNVQFLHTHTHTHTQANASSVLPYPSCRSMFAFIWC